MLKLRHGSRGGLPQLWERGLARGPFLRELRAGPDQLAAVAVAALLTAERLSKSFHLRPVLKNLSLSLETGETVLLLGRNGSGKSTLLSILAGLMRPGAGTASLNGMPLFTTDSRWRHEMAFLGHRPGLYPKFTARENLTLCLRLRGQPWDELEFMARMAHFGLAGREDEPVQVYSEGMLQRLGLVRLALSHWQVALLDEPSSSLDVDGLNALGEAMGRWRDQDRTILFTSPHPGWGATQADRALLLEGGALLREDLPQPHNGELAQQVKGGTP